VLFDYTDQHVEKKIPLINKHDGDMVQDGLLLLHNAHMERKKMPKTLQQLALRAVYHAKLPCKLISTELADELFEHYRTAKTERIEMSLAKSNSKLPFRTSIARTKITPTNERTVVDIEALEAYRAKHTRKVAIGIVKRAKKAKLYHTRKRVYSAL
jgi:hypothetical protein